MGTGRYDAFISYSHSERDDYIAKRLHYMLEHFHIPKKIQEISGKKKIERVFRDREELPLSSDLGANITEALKASEFLIVVCSPRSVRSRWVNKEIETFLSFHDRKKVLILLAEGEPEEVFPEILCRTEEKVIREDGTEETVFVKVEPMAADVRAGSKRKAEKKLKQELLRILAPMLSCSYDMLRQRHREYRFRRMLAAAGTVAVLAVVFMVYAFHQAAQIRQQYEETRRSQARYLSQVSGQLLESGDREGALQTALAVAPEDEDADEPVVPEQMYALNNALYSYRTADRLNFQPAYSYKMEGQAGYEDEKNRGQFDEEEDRYFCVDRLGNAYILDPENGECTWEISAEDIEGMEEDKICWISPVSGGKAVVVGQKHIARLDWKEKKTEKLITAEEDFPDTDMVYAASDGRAALSDGSNIRVYDLESGKLLCEASLVQNGYKRYNVNSLSISRDGNTVLLAASSDYYDVGPGGLFLLSAENGDLRMCSAENTAAAAFLGEGRAAAVQYRYVDGTEEIQDAPRQTYIVSVYDTDTGGTIWSSQPYDIQAYSRPCTLAANKMQVDGSQQDVIIASVKDRLLLFRADTGTVLQDRLYPEDIAGVSQFDGSRLLACLTDGKIMLCQTGEMETDFTVGQISADTAGFAYSRRLAKAVWTVSDSRRIVFGACMKDEDLDTISMGEEISDVEYFSVPGEEGEKQFYRCVLFEARQGEYGTGLAVYRTGSSGKIFEYRCRDTESGLESVNIRNVKDTPYIFFTVASGTQKWNMAADAGTGRICYKQLMSDGSGGEFYDVCYFHNRDEAVLYTRNQFTFGEISDQGIELPDGKTELFPAEGIENVQVSADDRFAVFVLNRPLDGTESGKCMQIWDIEQQKWIDIEGSPNLPASGDEVKLGKEKSIAALYTENGTIDVVNMETGAVESSVQCGYYSTIYFDFLNHDSYLISYGDATRLEMWDAQSGEILMRDEETDIPVSSIITDGSSRYFGIEFRGYIMSDNVMQLSELYIYYAGDDGRFYHYADVPFGYAGFEAGEVFTEEGGGSYGGLYDYRELADKAEKVLGGKKLDEAQKREYFI